MKNVLDVIAEKSGAAKKAADCRRIYGTESTVDVIHYPERTE